MFLRTMDLNTHFEYTKDLGLNTIRLEGKLEDDDWFLLASKHGILTMPGWSCCDAWEHWHVWKEEQYIIAGKSQISEAKRLRIHASVLVFLYGSDYIPPA